MNGTNQSRTWIPGVDDGGSRRSSHPSRRLPQSLLSRAIRFSGKTPQVSLEHPAPPTACASRRGRAQRAKEQRTHQTVRRSNKGIRNRAWSHEAETNGPDTNGKKTRGTRG